jgi:hypothetical protein
MTNQFIPEETLELEDGLSLYLRPSNCKRYGLEPYCNSLEEFSYGVWLGTNEKVGYHPEMIGSSKQHWYICQLNEKDGKTGDVKKIARSVSKKPGWLGQDGIFRGDCQYYAQRVDDIRKHFLSQHPGISRDFVYKCPVCLFGNKSITAVRKHMDTCAAITEWVKGGCSPDTLCSIYVTNIKHWTGQKIGGDLHHQKFKAGEEQKLLAEVREKTGGLSVKDVIPASNVKNKSATIQDVNIQDVNMSDDEDMLVESEAESSDDMLFGPGLNNTIQTEESDMSFDVKQYSSVRRIFDDKSYREKMTVDNKNEVMRLLSKEVLEQRTLMDLGRKLNILRKKCEGNKIDTEFLWALQDAFNTRLGSHIVKTEESGSMESLCCSYRCQSDRFDW